MYNAIKLIAETNLIFTDYSKCLLFRYLTFQDILLECMSSINYQCFP